MVTTVSESTRLWEKALQKINEKLDDKKTYDEFFADSYIYDINGDVITIVTRSKVAKVLLVGQYFNLITSVVNDLTNDTYKLNFLSPEDLELKKEEKKTVGVTKSTRKEAPSGFFENSSIKKDLTFDNFVVGNFNKEAHKAALYVAKNGGNMFNPLFIYSESGLGKTHLLHAIANEVLNGRDPNARIVLITAQDFVEEYIKFVTAEKENQSMRDYFKDIDIILLDDVQFFANKVKTEEAFFHIYQDFINKGKKIIITSDKQPSELKGLEDRLITRFNQGLTVKIEEPDRNTCVEILKTKIKNSDFDLSRIDDEVLAFFAEKFSGNIRELEGALNRLMFNALELEPNERITLEFASKSVSVILSDSDVALEVSAQKIINKVCDYYNVTPAQITSKVRTGQITLARHISMYLIKKHLDMSLKAIGNLFGGKDHTTVISGIKKVENELETDKQLQIAIEELEKLIAQ